MVAKVTVERETEGEHGWSYAVSVRDGQQPARTLTVTLAWVDYEHLCGGRVAPERIARAVVELLLEHWKDGPIPERFDASTVRRWVPGMDHQVRDRV